MEKKDYDLKIFDNDFFIDATTYGGWNPIPNKEGYVWNSKDKQIMKKEEYLKMKLIEQRRSKILKLKNRFS